MTRKIVMKCFKSCIFLVDLYFLVFASIFGRNAIALFINIQCATMPHTLCLFGSKCTNKCLSSRNPWQDSMLVPWLCWWYEWIHFVCFTSSCCNGTKILNVWNIVSPHFQKMLATVGCGEFLSVPFSWLNAISLSYNQNKSPETKMLYFLSFEFGKHANNIQPT